jgi:hypothetical protein
MLDSTPSSPSPSDWTEVTAPTIPSTKAELDAISCADATDCVAVGFDDNPSGDFDNGSELPLVDQLSAGTWTTSEPSLPSPNAGYYGPLDAVSCADAADCTAVGSYIDGDYNTQSLIETYASGGWSGIAGPALTGSLGSGNGAPTLTSVSCTSSTNCTAAGLYYDSNSHQQLYADAISSGTWAPGQQLAPPPSPEMTVASYPPAISAMSPTSFETVLNYDDTSYVESNWAVNYTS